MEGSRVVYRCEPEQPGTVDDVTALWEGESPVYFVTFDDGRSGVFDRSELMETSL